MIDANDLIDELRRCAAAGGGLITLLNLLHDRVGVPRYSRGLVLGWFHKAFALRPLDFTTIVFSCEIFKDGATRSIEDVDNEFRECLRQRSFNL